MDIHKYNEEDIKVVVGMLEEILDRLEQRKTLEHERKQVESHLNKQTGIYKLREPYISLIIKLAGMLGFELSSTATAGEITELRETVEYYAELEERNEQFLGELFKLQQELHKMAPDLVREAERKRDSQAQSTVFDLPVPVSSEDVEALFNMQYFFSQITPWHEDASFIVDGYNVIGRVPRYNYRVLDAKLGECRDALIRDLDYLKTQVEGDWCVVFDTIHASEETKVRDVRVIFPHGNRASCKESGDDRIVAEAARLVAEKRKVFVITNDADLSRRCVDAGATTLAVGQVFRY
jgi:predicted RNA-binding protein with PIN domain